MQSPQFCFCSPLLGFFFFFKKCTGSLPFSRDRECLIDISRHKAGRSGLPSILSECTGEEFILQISFPFVILAFTNPMI